MKLGLMGNATKEKLHEFLPKYVSWLEKKGIDFLLSVEFQEIPSLKNKKLQHPEEIGQLADIIISFGGDGTFLNSVRMLYGREVPVLGVNFGGLGYLAEIDAEALESITDSLLNGDWILEKRMILEAVVDGCNHGPWYALNDVVVDKGSFPRMIHLDTYLDERFLITYRSDGVIISTPTGSTAYSLSAGGPVIEPEMAGILVLPINPHSLSNRPLLIGDQKKIRIDAELPNGDFVVSVDGRVACRAESGKSVFIKRADFNAQLVTFEGRYFYDVLRKKLGWGDMR